MQPAWSMVDTPLGSGSKASMDSTCCSASSFESSSSLASSLFAGLALPPPSPTVLSLLISQEELSSFSAAVRAALDPPTLILTPGTKEACDLWPLQLQLQL